MSKKSISQEKLDYTYKSAQVRMSAHPEHTAKQKEIIDKCQYIKSDTAIKMALQMINNGNYDCRVWAKIEKYEEFYFLPKDKWIVTDNWDVSLAAEYIGLYLVYDDTDLQNMV